MSVPISVAWVSSAKCPYRVNVLRLWEDRVIGMRSGWHESGIIFAPSRQKRWLLFPKIRLERRVQGHIASIVQDQIELDFFGAGASHIRNIKRVSVGGKRGWDRRH